MSSIGPPGGANVIVDEAVHANTEAGVNATIAKQPSAEEREQTRIREQHAAMLATQQEHAMHMAEVRRLREAHQKQQQDAIENARLRRDSLINCEKLLIAWLSTDIVNACNEKHLVESMRREGVAQPITFMHLTPENANAFRLPGVTASELAMRVAAKSVTREVIVDRPGHVLHECKLRLTIDPNVHAPKMRIQVLADQIYKAVPVPFPPQPPAIQPKASCVMQ
jgi:hypothetical protein